MNLYLNRNYIWLSAAVGLYVMVFCPWAWPGGALFFYGLGAVVMIERPLLVWWRVYRHRELILQEVEVTLTSEGIERRTEAYTLRVAWDMVERADELKNAWIFTTKKQVRRIVVGKRRLSQERQAELAAFIKARRLDKHLVKSNPTQEASYALAYGIARSDLQPEVQAEYDRLTAERDPA